MPAYVPSLLDRLLGERAPVLTLEQYKDKLARDLEALLNTRAAMPPALAEAFPACAASILGYGLGDVAGLCLSSSDDRNAVCLRLKHTIERHEPRLADVQATLEPDGGAINRLGFVIHARLARCEGEPASFSAVLQPSSLRYSITHRSMPWT